MRGLGNVTPRPSSRLPFTLSFAPQPLLRPRGSEYERRFKELSDFCPNLVADELNKKRMFLNGLIETIALSLSGSDHPTYHSIRDAVLEVERQTLIR